MKSLHIFPGCHRLHYTKLDVGSKRDFPLKTVANRNDWQILMWTPQFRRHDWTARLVEEFGWKAGLLHCDRNFVRSRPKFMKTFFLLKGIEKGMETFRGQWHLVDTIFQNGRLFMDILRGWLFVDTFGDISWTILFRLSKHYSVPG